MAKKREQCRADELLKAKTITTTLQDIANRRGYSNPTHFRDTVLRSKQIPYERVSRQKWRVRLDDVT